jgi:hypothetical protein
MPYVTGADKPRSADCDDYYVPPLVIVPAVDESSTVFTGLYNDKGQKIYRSPNPVGFGKDAEW